MGKECREKITWSRMGRDMASVLIMLLIMLSWGCSFFYQYFTITHPNPTARPTSIISILSKTENSHTTNSYVSAMNNHSHTRNIQISNPKTYFHNRNAKFKATKDQSHTQNTQIKAINQHLNVAVTDRTNMHSHKNNIHTINTNIDAYNTTTITSTSTGRPQLQPQRSSSHAASSAPPTRSDAQCKERYQEEGPRRQVVLWTPFWHTWDGWKGMLHDHMRLKEGRCPTWRCEFLLGQNLTMDQVKEADAVIFFSLDVTMQPLPPRSPHALWIWLELEAPPISQMTARAWTEIERMGVFFNLTMSYHHQNRIIALLGGQLVPLSTPPHCPIPSAFYLNTSSTTYNSYSHHMHGFDAWQRKEGDAADAKLQAERDRRHGGLIRTAINKTTHPMPRADDFSENKPKDSEIPIMEHGELKLTAQEIALASRPRMAAWMASHCHTASRRESLVASLQRFIAITTVGKCGEMQCGKNHMDTYCYKWLAASHLFYLSFENALCDDYHTEKLWRPLEHGMVPVVYGGSNYRHSLPFHSYIDASNFSSVAALAKHLLHLATHPSVYLRYLQWRRYWRVRWPVHWCNLCEVLHSQAISTRTTMKHWWNTTTTCHDPPAW